MSITVSNLFRTVLYECHIIIFLLKKDKTSNIISRDWCKTIVTTSFYIRSYNSFAPSTWYSVCPIPGMGDVHPSPSARGWASSHHVPSRSYTRPQPRMCRSCAEKPPQVRYVIPVCISWLQRNTVIASVYFECLVQNYL